VAEQCFDRCPDEALGLAVSVAVLYEAFYRLKSLSYPNTGLKLEIVFDCVFSWEKSDFA
jgi:hypothetical protein